MARVHSFYKPRIEGQYKRETDSLRGIVDAAARTSAAHEKPMSLAELQQLDPPPTPAGVKREGVGGYIYPKSDFEVL